MILDTIVASTRERVTMLKKVKPIDVVKSKALAKVDAELAANDGVFPFPFEKALREGDMNFICEVKKASPSKGMIVEDFPFIQIAKDYEKAGAAAISVLTEPAYFMGVDTYVTDISEVVNLPVLRKDFIVDEYQVYESKVLGASAILLLCSVLNEEELRSFGELANSLGLSCLVEAHNEDEVQLALKVGARIIGVNNRDLRDFSVDIQNSIRLRHLVPDDIIFVSESGLQTGEDIQQLREHGIHAALIGERFMKSPDKVKALAELYGPVRGTQIKVCGLSRTEDITIVNTPTLRPAYAGFVFADSKRQVTVQTARNLISQLAPQVQAVGVFVNEDIHKVAHLAETLPLPIVQLCGDETIEDIKALRQLTTARIWKSVQVRTAEDATKWNDSPVDLLVFDAYSPDKRGGTGEAFDWTLLKGCTKPFILAGGLKAQNVARAIRVVRPYAVDVSSGVEVDGVKSREKIEEFMTIARSL